MGFSSEIRKGLVSLLEKLPHLLIVIGVVCVFFSFASFSPKFEWPQKTPHWFFFAFGCILFLGGVIIYLISTKKVSKKLQHLTSIVFNTTTVTLHIGNIQDANSFKEGVFILPVNTTFVDDCATDVKSALGSFLNKHHSEKIPVFNKNVLDLLKSNHIFPNNGQYKPATALLLTENYSMPAKVLLVASSVKSEGTGFFTDLSTVSASINEVFRITADKRLTTFYFPIIGSGHAGLDINDALCLLLLCIKFAARRFNHIKNVHIFVRPEDCQRINAQFLNYLK